MVLTLLTALLLKTVIYKLDGWSKGLLDGFIMAVNLITMLLFCYRFVRVQGNFLCEQYFPKPCQSCFLAFNRVVGWKPPPELPLEPAPVQNKEEGNNGEALLTHGPTAATPADYW